MYRDIRVESKQEIIICRDTVKFDDLMVREREISFRGHAIGAPGVV